MVNYLVTTRLQNCIAIALGGIAACHDTNDMNQSASREPDASSGNMRNIVVHEHRQCFSNEYNEAGRQQGPDVLVLTVNLAGETVSGNYDWLPVYKDKRRGVFSGRINDSHIVARYEFQQEGLSQVVAISISLDEDRAIVRGGPEELGLDATISRVPCQ